MKKTIKKNRNKRRYQKKNLSKKRSSYKRKKRNLKGGWGFGDLMSNFEPPDNSISLGIIINKISLIKLFVGPKTGKILRGKQKINISNDFKLDNYMDFVYDQNKHMLYIYGIPVKLNDLIDKGNSGNSGKTFLVFEQYIDLAKIVNMLTSGFDEARSNQKGGSFIKKIGSSAWSAMKKKANSAFIWSIIQTIKLIKQFVLKGMVRLSLILLEDENGSVSLQLMREGGGPVCPPDVICDPKKELTCEQGENERSFATIAVGIKSLSEVKDLLNEQDTVSQDEILSSQSSPVQTPSAQTAPDDEPESRLKLTPSKESIKRLSPSRLSPSRLSPSRLLPRRLSPRKSKEPPPAATPPQDPDVSEPELGPEPEPEPEPEVRVRTGSSAMGPEMRQSRSTPEPTSANQPHTAATSMKKNPSSDNSETRFKKLKKLKKRLSPSSGRSPFRKRR